MRRQRKYKLSFNDESRLQNIWELQLSLPKIILLSVISFIVIITLSICLIMLTPLKTLLPGYMKKSQRIDTIEAIMRLDSLQNAFNQNQIYLNNILTVYDTERTSSDKTSIDTIHQNEISDSLILQSEEERKFIQMMEEREKYNISILAPLAADGMIFTMPCDAGIITEDSKSSVAANIIIPQGAAINSITDGTVINVFFNHSERAYTITIQHNKGFISEYTGLGQPIVKQGDKVISGQRIALYPNSTNKKEPYITLRIWRNGVALNPYDYIKDTDFSKVPKIDEEIGRGK